MALFHIFATDCSAGIGLIANIAASDPVCSFNQYRLGWLVCPSHQSAISAVIMLLGGLLARLHNDSNMASIVLVIFFCLAVMPTLLMGSLLFVLETSALAESRKAN